MGNYGKWWETHGKNYGKSNLTSKVSSGFFFLGNEWTWFVDDLGKTRVGVWLLQFISVDELNDNLEICGMIQSQSTQKMYENVFSRKCWEHLEEKPYMGMDQYLLIPFLVGWTWFTSYFDVHQGYKVLTHCHISGIKKTMTFLCFQSSHRTADECFHHLPGAHLDALLWCRVAGSLRWLGRLCLRGLR